MLKKNKSELRSPSGFSFAIIASEYNARYVNAMLKAAKARLRGADAVKVVRVPGAFEIPAVAARLAATGDYDALICLGIVIRGATTHAAHISEAVTLALVNLQLEWQIPVVHEVLLLENEEQAKERCLDPDHTRGLEAANTAVKMAALMKRL